MATTTALIRSPTSTPTTSAAAASRNTQSPLVPPSYPPSPGTWRHPKFTEIVQRQSASTFSNRNLRAALSNALALLLSFFFSSYIHTAISPVLTALAFSNPARPAFWPLLATRLYFLTNIVSALLPLFPFIVPTLKPRDQITDIPLTPSQRNLLGLDPSIPSAMPDSATSSNFITPPRYRRSSSSSTASSNNSAPLTTTPDRRSTSATYFSSSPLSASPRNAFSPSTAFSPFRSRNASPFSPSASPLLHKAIATTHHHNNNREETDRRHSLGTSGSVSGLRRSQSLREHGVNPRDGQIGLETPSTSPVGGGGGMGRRRNPYLNYKWMYEKGSRLPMSETILF